jgi:2-phospho-L-lactate guanylyltransferase
MAGIVVPFRGYGGKQRLTGLGPDVHGAVVLAMLADVLAATVDLGRTVVVTSDADGRRIAAEAGAEVVDDPGGGQGAAVAAALRGFPSGRVLVVNGDLPCVRPEDLRALLAVEPLDGIALVASADGRTNALRLPGSHLFEPLYGPRSAARFERAARARGTAATMAAIPNLADDVDTPADLELVHHRAGTHTRAVLDGVRLAS